MRGLTWDHILCFLILIILLAGIGTSSAPYTFNYEVFTSLWQVIKSSGGKFYEGQSAVAERLTAQVNANSQGNARLGDCASDPNEDSRSLSPNEIGLLKGKKTRADVLEVIGAPYCQTFDQSDLWRMTDGKTFWIGKYDPIISRFN
jgi:hypothetical protein